MAPQSNNRTPRPSTLVQEGDEITSAERPKRRKIAQACQQCRARKSRCDGVKPVCSECAQRTNQKQPCRYASNREQDHGHDEYVHSLLDRIRDLEARERNAVPILSPTPDSRSQQNRSHQGQPETIPQNISSSPLSMTTPHSRQGSSILHEHISPVDAMGANADITNPEGADDRFYGSSSMVSFVQQVYKTIGNDRIVSRDASPSRAPNSVTHGGQVEQNWDLAMLDQMTLLPRPFMDKILNVYWDKVYHLYPFIHKPTFLQAYELLWSSESSGNNLETSSIGLLGSKAYGPGTVIFHCALNNMLALAIQFMDFPPQDRTKLGRLLAEKGRNLCKLDFFDDGSLAVVQALLLTAQYLQSTPYPTRCWNCIGIACRIAQGLGLHVEVPQAQKQLNELEIEMCRRVWHGCVILDTVVSMALGRPMMLYKHQSAPMPKTRSDELIAQPSQGGDPQSWIIFYVESIKLYRILADVVAQFYDKSNTSSESSEVDDNLDIVLRIDTALSKFEHGIPDLLHSTRRASSAAEITNLSIFKQQASVLCARCLHVRILLYRPIFTRWCQSLRTQEALGQAVTMAGSTELSVTIQKSLSVACVESSIQLIETVHRSSFASMTGAWWYNVFYARISGMVIILATACPPVVECIGLDRLNSAWAKCQELLQFLQQFSPTVGSSLRGLRRMHRHVINQQAKRKNQMAMNNPTSVLQSDNANLHGTELSQPDPSSTFTSTTDDDLTWLMQTDTALFDEILNFDFNQTIPTDFG